MRDAPRIFAIDTRVPVDKTRQEIIELLREWGCRSTAWAEDYDKHQVILQFSWASKSGAIYRMRFTITIPTSDRGRIFKPEQQAQASRSAHRLLLLKLKADLNAINCGLAKAEEIFMPWMVDVDGKTIAEFLLPQLESKYAALPPKREDPK